MMHEEGHVAESLAELLDIYGDLVYRIAFQNMRNKSDAEDVTQDVYIKIMKKMPAFDCVKAQRSWIIRVTINTCKDRWKYNRLRQGIELTPIQEFAIEEDKDYGLLYEVQKLPMKYRSVIYLFYYEDMSVHEIAATLQKKEKTVLTWLHRARKLLKVRLEGGDQDE